MCNSGFVYFLDACARVEVNEHILCAQFLGSSFKSALELKLVLSKHSNRKEFIFSVFLNITFSD